MPLLFAGCVPVSAQIIPTQMPPTPDLNLVRTDAAQIVIAEITRQASLATPTFTATSAPPTVPPTPITAVLMAPITVVPPQNSSGWTVFPTITKTPYIDSAVLESQSPEDGRVVSPGDDFQVKWVFRNTGKRPWNSEFYFKPLTSTLDPSPSGIQNLSGSVATGDTVDFSIFVEAPDEEGIYYIRYALINDNAISLYQFYFSIKVQP